MSIYLISKYYVLIKTMAVEDLWIKRMIIENLEIDETSEIIKYMYH